jgi:hypothetical protein
MVNDGRNDDIHIDIHIDIDKAGVNEDSTHFVVTTFPSIF